MQALNPYNWNQIFIKFGLFIKHLLLGSIPTTDACIIAHALIFRPKVPNIIQKQTDIQ